MKRKLMLGNKIKVFSNFKVTFLVVFLVLATVLLGCSTPDIPPSVPIEVDLSISNAPALNETAELTCTITAVFDAPNTSAQIILTDELPPIITKEEAMAIGGGTRAELIYYDPESTLSLTNPIPENPCWAVSVYDDEGWNIDAIVVDAVTGEIVGHDIPIP